MHGFRGATDKFNDLGWFLLFIIVVVQCFCCCCAMLVIIVVVQGCCAMLLLLCNVVYCCCCISVLFSDVLFEVIFTPAFCFGVCLMMILKWWSGQQYLREALLSDGRSWRLSGLLIDFIKTKHSQLPSYFGYCILTYIMLNVLKWLLELVITIMSLWWLRCWKWDISFIF